MDIVPPLTAAVILDSLLSAKWLYDVHGARQFGSETLKWAAVFSSSETFLWCIDKGLRPDCDDTMEATSVGEKGDPKVIARIKQMLSGQNRAKQNKYFQAMLDAAGKRDHLEAVKFIVQECGQQLPSNFWAGKAGGAEWRGNCLKW